MAIRNLRHNRIRLGVAISIGLAAISASSVTARPRGGVPRYATAVVERGNIVAVVRAAGTIHPVITVPVPSAIPGTVKQVYADLNTRVQAGQVLAQLDPTTYEDEVRQARSRLAQAETVIRDLQASLPTQQASVEAHQASLTRLQAIAESSRTDAARVANLFQQGILPQDQHDQSQVSLQRANAQVREAETQLHQSQARREEARAQLGQSRVHADVMRGALQQAETNLRYTTILSPMDGVVVARNITPGRSVDATPAATLFAIAQDLRRMQVNAFMDESDTAQIHVGADVTIQTDVFPTEVLRGRVSAIRPSAEAAPGTVNYETVIEFENAEEHWLPGMVAYVTIPAGHAANTLKVPSAALRFAPEMPHNELLALYEKHKIPADVRQPGGWQVVWRLNARRRIAPVAVRVGVTDHHFTQLLEGNLKEGDTLITGQSTGPRTTPRTSTAIAAPAVGAPRQ